MKKSLPNLTLSTIYCGIFGHNYEVTRHVTNHVKEYTCKCCQKQLTTDSDGHLTELTPMFKEINLTLERINALKNIRSKKQVLASSIY